MQIIGRIESVIDDLIIKTDTKTGEITSARGVLNTFKPTGVFEFSVDKQFIAAGLITELQAYEGQKLLYSFARVDMDLPDGGRYRTWSLRTLPETLDSINEVKKPVTFTAPSSSPAPTVKTEKDKF